jgi:hypothetical protein
LKEAGELRIISRDESTPRRIGLLQVSVLKAYLRQGCRIFLGGIYQSGKNIPNNQQIYLMAMK